MSEESKETIPTSVDGPASANETSAAKASEPANVDTVKSAAPAVDVEPVPAADLL